MIHVDKRFRRFLVPAVMLAVTACTLRRPAQGPASTLTITPTQSRFDTFFAATPAGQAAKAHIVASLAHGEDAEARYQASLAALTTQPGAAEALHAAYRNVPEDHYLLRTALVEGLKQLRSTAALLFLRDIALEKIPPDRQSENAEIDTRIDEVVIRVTAVEGLSILAGQRSQEADDLLLRLISGHEDLTVRQMATRGYLSSPFGDAKERAQRLRQTLPAAEHWYIITERTEIRRVPHPPMPAKFDLDPKRTTNAPEVQRP